jgi:hypothetical protein
MDSNNMFDVRDAAGKAVPKRVYKHPELIVGFSIIGGVLKPGDSATNEYDLSRLVDFSRPGRYSIQMSRFATSQGKNIIVKSNKITIVITP